MRKTAFLLILKLQMKMIQKQWVQCCKEIQRSEYQEYIKKNKERVEQDKNYYRRRQAIVEQPYVIIKRLPTAIWRGFSYIMTKKTIKRAEADVGLIVTAYNLSRIINIISVKTLMAYLTEVLLIIFAQKGLFAVKTNQYKLPKFWKRIINIFFMPLGARLIFGRKLETILILVK